MKAYRIQVAVFAPDLTQINRCGLELPAVTVGAATEEGLAEFVGGFLGAITGDIATIVREHAGVGGGGVTAASVQAHLGEIHGSVVG